MPYFLRLFILILEQAKGKALNVRWINHFICVGNCAGVIAGALGMDIDYAKTLGYIHDIGKSVGEFSSHVMNGYYFLKSLGYDDAYCNICLTHFYLNNDVYCVAGGIPEGITFRTEFIRNYRYTLYEKIINLCDLMCKDQVMTVEKRLIDLITRYGAFDDTQYHVKEAMKLKLYFDDLLGYRVYDLFPMIKDHL